MKHVFVFDPKAFHNQQWKMDGILDNIGQFFRTQDKPDFSIQISRYRRNAIAIIQEEASKSRENDIVRIYAVGGEELLYDCVNGVAYFDNMELAAVPYGESNDFYSIFGEGKTDLFRDIPSVVKSESIPTDIIKWGINYALNSCYIGFNSVTSLRLKKFKMGLNNSGFIVFSKLSAFFNYIALAFNNDITNQEYKITIDDKDYSGNYSLIHVANGPYYNGKKTGAYSALPNDGFLDITLIKSADPLKTMWALGRYSGGKRPSNCVFLQGEKISVSSEKQMWIQLDNEYFQDTSIDLSIVPKAVNIVAVDNLSYPADPQKNLRPAEDISASIPEI
ncbi:MAG: hypothetical protein FWC03_05755 [Treponema sp.]|nr:hypothetical protein [Treponema sp.]